MNDLLSSAALLYSIPFRQIVTLKKEKVFTLLTAEERFILKKTNFSTAENQFLTAALLHLKRQGFHRCNELIPAKSGEYITEINSSHYFLTKALEGRTPDYRNPPDASKVGAYLGELHCAVEGFYPLPAWETRNKWGKMLSSMKIADNELEKISQIIQDKTIKDEFDLLFNGSIQSFREQIRTARSELEPIYPALWRKQFLKGGFIHHDPAHHNFVIDTENRVSAFDFDYAVADFAIHDVAAFLLKIFKANAWQIQTAIEAYKAYISIRPVTEEERKAIKALLTFPYDYYRAAFAHYFENNHSRHLKKKLLHAITEVPLKQNTVIDFYRQTEEIG